MVAIYILKCEQDKYYVGKSKNADFRIKDHFEKGGSQWTKKYKPIEIVEIRDDCKDSDEQIITQEYMKKYGIQNVRGGPWCKKKITEDEESFIEGMIRGNDDICYICGKSGHFARYCKDREELGDKFRVKKQRVKKKKFYCRFCNKTFKTERGLNCHEKSICRENPTRYDQICLRCGYKGHTHDFCYAKRHKNGKTLGSPRSDKPTCMDAR